MNALAIFYFLYICLFLRNTHVFRKEKKNAFFKNGTYYFGAWCLFSNIFWTLFMFDKYLYAGQKPCWILTSSFILLKVRLTKPPWLLLPQKLLLLRKLFFSFLRSEKCRKTHPWVLSGILRSPKWILCSLSCSCCEGSLWISVWNLSNVPTRNNQLSLPLYIHLSLCVSQAYIYYMVCQLLFSVFLVIA